MRKAKRLISLLITAAIMCAVIAGCGKSNKASMEIPVLKNGEVYTPTKDMEITVWQTQGSDYVPPAKVANPLVENWLVNKTKVKVKNAYGNGGGQWEAVLARLIAGDNFPEIVACGAGQGPTHFNRLAQADQIWELTPEMLQMYAPDIWEKVPDSMWERIKVNGKIYGIPYQFATDRRIDPNVTDEEINLWGSKETEVGRWLWIRDDIAKMLYPNCMDYNEIISLIESSDEPIGDKLMDIPINSTSDLVKLFRDIKALNLKEGNKPVYAFGYSGADCWVPYARLGANMMGYNGHNYTSTWNAKKKEITLPLTEDIVHDGALIQNQLLREGVFDKESLIHTDAQCKEKVLGGRYATVVLSAIMDVQAANDTLTKNNKPFHYRPLYVNIPAAEGYEMNRKMPTWGATVGILKAVKAEDMPQILNWLNTQFTDEYEEVRFWGPKEAGLYEERSDGKRHYTNELLDKLMFGLTTEEIPKDQLTDLGKDTIGMFSIRFKQYSARDPQIVNKLNRKNLNTSIKFPANSKYWTEGVLAPPCDAWSAEYASLESVTKYWSTRSKWEDPFKVALSATSDEDFETKWQAAIDSLNSVVDVKAMCKEMTDIARKIELVE